MPDDSARIEALAARLQFHRREDVAVRPKTALERVGIALGQAASPHLGRRGLMVIIERAVLDTDAAIEWRENTEPHAWRPIIPGHSNNAGVVPEAGAPLTGEGQTAMPADNAVATGGRQFFIDRLAAGREDETIDAG